MDHKDRTDITLYKEFATPELYEDIMAAPEIYRHGAAQSLWADLTLIALMREVPFPEEITAEFLQEMAALIDAEGKTTLGAMVDESIQSRLRSYLEYLAIKDTPEFKKDYEDYLEHADEWID